MQEQPDSASRASFGEFADPSADYATPVQVDCPAAADRDAVAPFGGCDAPVFDFRYRVSRFADSERSSGGLGPQRDRPAARSLAIATGLPPRRGTVAFSSAPPLAIYALGRLSLPAETRLMPGTEAAVSTRVLEPPDRPPRA